MTLHLRHLRDATRGHQALNMPDTIVLCGAAVDPWDAHSSFGANSDRGSDGIGGGSTTGTSRRGMFAVLRIEDLGIIGEKGTKVRAPIVVLTYPRLEPEPYP